MRRSLAAALAALLAAGVALAGTQAKPRPRFEVLAHVNLGEPYTGDVVAHAGNAYLSSWGGRACRSPGVRILSLADPRRPQLVGRFADAKSRPELDGTWTEKTIVRRVATASFSGDLAVTSIQDCRRGAFEGFALYDVSDPRAPRELALVPLEPRGSHEIWLQRRRDRVYVWAAVPGSERTTSPDGTQPGRADFRIYDVSNPASPRQVGEWGAWKELGIRPDRVPERFLDWNFVHSAIGNAAGTRAFLSYWDLGTVVLDVSDPTRPRYLGRTAPGRGNAHSAWLGRGERLLAETHETEGGTVTLWDVANPRRPARLSEFGLPGSVLARGRGENLERLGGLDLGDSVHDAKLVGNVAFFSWYRQGVVAADVSKPRRPRFLARFLPPPTSDPAGSFCPDSACVSTWGVFHTGRVLLASDMVGGLWVLRFRR